MYRLDRSDSQLAIIDVQTAFYAPERAIDRERLAAVTATIAWLTGVAAALEVPIIITEEDPERNGGTEAAVLARAPAGTSRFVKAAFGLADVPAILAAVEAQARQTVVLVGLETDVCVAQSALGLLERGYRVAVVPDATFSPGEMHEHGLRLMRDAGVVTIHAKGVYYEWVRTLAEARSFETRHADLAEPPGFSL